MIITIINDCRDANAAARQGARASALMNAPVSFIGAASDLEASGNLVDILDAAGDSESVILVNVAPRNGHAKKWPNGTPFGYFWYRKTLVVASIDGLTLSLVKKLKLVDAIHVLDTAETSGELAANGAVSLEVKDAIVNSQFRSFDFVPRVAAYLVKNKETKSMPLDIDTISDAPAAVWWVDNFGNCKTTVFSDDEETKEVIRKQARFAGLFYAEGLKDVSDSTAALIKGSSGLGEKRFLEIVVQGESAAKRFGLLAGDLLL